MDGKPALGFVEPFREVNLSDGKCNVSLYVCEEEERRIDQDPEYASELFKAALEGRLPSACDESETEGSDAVTEEKIAKDENASEEIEWDDKLTQVFVDLCEKTTEWLPLNKAGSRRQLFLKIKQDLYEEGYSVSLEGIREKFNSLVNTYRRIKLKTKQEGVVKTKWQYFDVFDEIMKTSESSKQKGKNSADNVKDSNLPQIKIEANSDSVKIEADSDSVDDPGEPSPSPPRKQFGSSSTLFPAESMVNSKTQKPTNKNIPKTLTGNPASRKRKRNELDCYDSKDSSSNSNNHLQGIDHIVVGGEGFSHAATLLFIDCIKKHKDMLKLRKSSEMFMLIKKEMASEGFSFTEAKLRKKWANLLISYKRILERANETGDLVSNWTYYEVIDSIIVDTKDLVGKRREEMNRFGDFPKASTSDAFNRKVDQLQAADGCSEFSNESRLKNNQILGINPRRGHPVVDILRQSNNSFHEKSGEHEKDLRNLLEEWKNRETRRDERDQVKLEVLKEISKSVNQMISKQDELMTLLKSMQ